MINKIEVRKSSRAFLKACMNGEEMRRWHGMKYGAQKEWRRMLVLFNFSCCRHCHCMCVCVWKHIIITPLTNTCKAIDY